MTDAAEEKEESLFEAPPIAEQERMCEAILFATAEPVTVRELEARMPHGCDAAEALVHLRKRYEGRGVRLLKVDDAWAIRTAPDLGFLMEKDAYGCASGPCGGAWAAGRWRIAGGQAHARPWARGGGQPF